MAKPLQQDENGNIMNDVETQKNQKGYAAYEAENARKQSEMESKDQATKDKWMGILKGGMNILSSPMKTPNKTYKKGGSVSSASKRADGCCVKGKTRGKIV
jgi:hypothetical protein